MTKQKETREVRKPEQIPDELIPRRMGRRRALQKVAKAAVFAGGIAGTVALWPRGEKQEPVHPLMEGTLLDADIREDNDSIGLTLKLKAGGRERTVVVEPVDKSDMQGPMELKRLSKAEKDSNVSIYPPDPDRQDLLFKPESRIVRAEHWQISITPTEP
ncbi:MAG: hypothetical protein GF416_09240 [Candidatus Altiarchaeales archaeon]|nr:hypothetical protein [Candidatus Altiarchaeales archaeon]MBD3417303.1 hypothetical protein [Candidatus Altiarchaeales archaeon]